MQLSRVYHWDRVKLHGFVPAKGVAGLTTGVLRDVTLVFALAAGVLFVSHRLRLPIVVGLLATGILAGPSGLGLVRPHGEVELLAELGVVLLLFTIGLEFSLAELWRIRRAAILGGGIQVGLTALAGYAVARGLGASGSTSVVAGLLAAMSSTAIVLRLLQERGETESLAGRVTLGILIFQDIAVVAMVLAVPLLAAAGSGGPTPAGGPGGLPGLAGVLVKTLLLVGLTVVGARWAVPALLFQVARTRSREIFLLTLLALGLTVTGLTAAAGLSLALGAFLAGLLVSESEYSHHALGNVLPFRDVFTSFFFISIGMLLDLDFVFAHAGAVLGTAAAVVAGKGLLAGLAVAVLGFPVRAAVTVGLALAQVGEFSFVLAGTADAHGLLPGGAYQLFLSVAILTMALTPFTLAAAPRVSTWVSRRWQAVGRAAGIGAQAGSAEAEAKGLAAGLHGHLVIIGYGVNGRNVARAAAAAGIPYLVVDTNPETVREERARGVPIVFGDAGYDPVLELAGVERARVVVVAISDAAATRRVTQEARRLNPAAHVIVRTRYLWEIEPLLALGASEVIPEEFETSVEIFARVLARYLVPRDEIARHIADIRRDSYGLLRGDAERTPSPGTLSHVLGDAEISVVRVAPGSAADGHTPEDLALRRQYGTTLLAIGRKGRIVANPGARSRLEAGDAAVLMGTPERLAEAARLFRRDSG